MLQVVKLRRLRKTGREAASYIWTETYIGEKSHEKSYPNKSKELFDERLWLPTMTACI